MTITPTSESQFAASTGQAVPPAEQVRDDVWSFPTPMPGRDLPCSFISVLRDSRGGVHLIDAGFDTDTNYSALAEFLTSIGSDLRDVRSMTITHNHADHQGMATRIRAATGATIQMHADEASELPLSALRPVDQLDLWGVPPQRRAEMSDLPIPGAHDRVTSADVLLDEGERLDIPGFDVVAMHTPGHTPGHLTLRDDARSLLFTGDHLLPTMHPGLGLGGPSESNPIADYLDGLDRVAAFEEHEVLPGHGYRFSGVATRAAQTRLHHLMRSRDVAAILESQDEPSVWQIAEQLNWTAGWENLRGFYAYSALSQTALHCDYLSRLPRHAE